MKEVLKFAPTIMIIGALLYFTRKIGSGMMGGMGGGVGGAARMGKSTAKKIEAETDILVKFKDVAGCEEAKVRDASILPKTHVV